MQNDLSVITDDTTYDTSYINCQNSPTRPSISDLDAATISTLLGPSERINIRDDQLSENSSYAVSKLELLLFESIRLI